MPDRSDRVGQQLGNYRLLRYLGSGGFGDVYLGELVRTQERVAIKVLHGRLTDSNDLKEFINEARTFRLKHPHILPLLDFGIASDDLPYLVMEYAANGTLRERHPKGTLKSLNQYYNKCRAHQQSRLSHENRFTSRQLDRMTTKRNRRVDSYLHTASRRIIDLLVEEGIGTLVIGNNPLWKQEVHLGKRNNQSFVQLPHARFIDQLSYKGKLVGIKVIVQEESYTSKASFLDHDPIPTYRADRREQRVFSGKRIARSWYRASDGTILHADINGSYNILCKSSSDPWQLGRGVAGAAVRPRRLAV